MFVRPPYLGLPEALMPLAQHGVPFRLWPQVDEATEARLIEIAKATPQRFPRVEYQPPVPSAAQSRRMDDAQFDA